MKILFSLLVLFSSLSNKEPVGEIGISFFTGKYAEARALAKKINKPIFIDDYTVWCGPCKKMAKDVFTDSDVGSFFNKNFINVKMDMEKTSGALIGRRYDVHFYPTLLFILPSGELIRKEVGYHSKAKLLKVARDVVH